MITDDRYLVLLTHGCLAVGRGCVRGSASIERGAVGDRSVTCRAHASFSFDHRTSSLIVRRVRAKGSTTRLFHAVRPIARAMTRVSPATIKPAAQAGIQEANAKAAVTKSRFKATKPKIVATLSPAAAAASLFKSAFSSVIANSSCL